MRVVILGSGFGGVHTLLGLKKLIRKGFVEVILISRQNYFLFTPLLHEVASGKVEGINTAILVSELLREEGFNFLLAEVEEIDISSKQVKTNVSWVDYDVLVVALGASTSFFGIPGAESLSTFKTLADAEGVREELDVLLKKAKSESVKIVIIGGGATGVEMAAEMADLFAPFKETEILLLEAMADILPGTHPRLKEVAKKSLTKRGVEIMLGSAVTKVGNKSIELARGEKVNFDFAIWTAGVKARDIRFVPSQPKSKANRLKVLPTLQLENCSSIFALGDIADGHPMTAQVAVNQARVTARNIEALVKQKPLFSKFIYTPSGMMFSLGRWMAGAEVKLYLLNKVLYFWGMTAWLFWHLVYLVKIPGIKNKMRIGRDWIRNFLR